MVFHALRSRWIHLLVFGFGLLIGGGVVLSLNWLSEGTPEGVTEDEVWAAAVQHALESTDVPEGTRASVVAYGGESCGGVVEFRYPEGRAYWAISEDSYEPVIAGSALSTSGEAKAAIDDKQCRWR